MSRDTLDVLARLTATDIVVRDVCDQWLLITYDIPNTEDGNKERRRFLTESKSIGATRHTDSVYLMPWTPSAEALALQLARVAGGEVVVWTSTMTDPGQAATVTKSYDDCLVPVMDEITERIDRILEYQRKNWHKRANKMMLKTEKMLAQMEGAIMRRGSVPMFLLLQMEQKRFARC